jgi:DNA-directed RNA polymerase specialized sigma24 family protein
MHPQELQSGEFYTEHFTILRKMAMSRYGLSAADAEELAHELLVACLCQVKRIDDPLIWLTGALQCAVQRRERHV